MSDDHDTHSISETASFAKITSSALDRVVSSVDALANAITARDLVMKSTADRVIRTMGRASASLVVIVVLLTLLLCASSWLLWKQHEQQQTLADLTMKLSRVDGAVAAVGRTADETKLTVEETHDVLDETPKVDLELQVPSSSASSSARPQPRAVVVFRPRIRASASAVPSTSVVIPLDVPSARVVKP